MIAIQTDETAMTLANPENPSTDFIKLSTTEQSLIEKGVIVGQRFDVNESGEVHAILFKPLTEAQAAVLPVGSLYFEGGHLKFRMAGGINNITG